MAREEIATPCAFAASRILSCWATSNNGGLSANSLSYARGVAVDANDNLYIVDGGNHRVLFYPAGTTTATRVYGQGGVFTTGKTTSTLKANTITVTSGKTAKLKRALVKGEVVTVQVGVVDGDIDSLQMMVNGVSYNSDVKNGKLMGAFDFIGFEPEST